jgi:hypothetical protein
MNSGAQGGKGMRDGIEVDMEMIGFEKYWP